MPEPPNILTPREPFMDPVLDAKGKPTGTSTIARSWWRFLDSLQKLSGQLAQPVVVAPNSIITAGDINAGSTVTLADSPPATVLGNSSNVAAPPEPQVVASSLSFTAGTLAAASQAPFTLTGNPAGIVQPPSAIVIGDNLLLSAGTLSATEGGTITTDNETWVGSIMDARGQVGDLSRRVDDAYTVALLGLGGNGCCDTIVDADSLFGNSESFATKGSSIAIGTNLSLIGGTLSATGSIAASITVGANSLFGNPAGTAALGSNIAIGPGLTLSATGTLSNSAPDTNIWNAGTVTAIGPNLTLAAGTLDAITQPQEWSAGTVTTIGANVTITSGTLSVSSPGTGTVTQIVTNASPYLNNGTITTSGTITAATLAASSLIGNAATTAAVPGAITVGPNLTLSPAGTLSASAPGTGTVTQVVSGDGLVPGTITNSGTVALATIAAGSLSGNAATVAAVATAIAVGSGLSLSPAGTLTSTGSGGTVTQIVAGANLTGGTITGSGTVAIQASPTFTLSGTLPVTVNGLVTLPAGPTTPVPTVRVVGAVNGVVAIETYGKGSANPEFSGRHSAGTGAAPTATANTRTLAQFTGYGYGTTGYTALPSAGLFLNASQDWTDTANGASASIQVTKNGTIAAFTPFFVDNSGIVVVGNGTVVSGTLALQVTGGIQTDNLGVSGTLAAFPLGAGLALSSGLLVNTAPDTNIWNAGTVTLVGTGVTLTSGTLTAGGSGGTVTQIVAGSNLTGGTITGSGTIALQASPTITVQSLATLTVPMIINGNSAVPASLQPQTGLALIGSPASNAGYSIDAYGGGPLVTLRRADGTVGTPSGPLANENIGGVRTIPYGTTAWAAAARASHFFFAAENQTDAAQGAYQTFSVTKIGGTVTSEAMRLQDTGILTIGTTAASGTNKLQVIGGATIDNLVLGSGTATAVAGAATLNTQNGRVTSEALTAAATYTLTLTNSKILSTSTVILTLTNSASLPVTLSSLTISAGSAVIVVGMAALTGTVVIRFAVYN